MNVQELLTSLEGLAKNKILVGIPQADAARHNDPVINNAYLGYIHEFGSPAKNIPARPFLLPTIRDNEPFIAKMLEKAMLYEMDGEHEKAIQAMERLGQTIRDRIKRKIGSNIQPALAVSTLKARRSRGVTRTNTLIDTGALQQSINYVRVRT